MRLYELFRVFYAFCIMHYFYCTSVCEDTHLINATCLQSQTYLNIRPIPQCTAAQLLAVVYKMLPMNDCFTELRIDSEWSNYAWAAWPDSGGRRRNLTELWALMHFGKRMNTSQVKGQGYKGKHASKEHCLTLLLLPFQTPLDACGIFSCAAPGMLERLMSSLLTAHQHTNGHSVP